MTEFGWFFTQNFFAYGLLIFRHYYWKYEEYNRKNNTITRPHIRGVGRMPPVIFFLLLHSIYLFFFFNQVSIDFDLEEPYTVDYVFYSWDTIEDRETFLTKTWPEFLGVYKILDRQDYEKVDWGLPCDIKMHKFLIFVWWLALLRDFFLHLRNYYKNFFDFMEKDSNKADKKEVELDEIDEFFLSLEPYLDRYEDFLYKVKYKMEDFLFEPIIFDLWVTRW